MAQLRKLMILCLSVLLLGELPAAAVDINAKKFNDRVSSGRRSFVKQGNRNRARAYKRMGLSAWMSDKLAKGRMKNWIDIEILDEVYSYEILNNGSAMIVFDQIYKSDTYVDRGLKYLYLTRYNGSWRILREEQPDYVELCSDSCSNFTTYR